MLFGAIELALVGFALGDRVFLFLASLCHRRKKRLPFVFRRTYKNCKFNLPFLRNNDSILSQKFCIFFRYFLFFFFFVEMFFLVVFTRFQF